MSRRLFASNFTVPLLPPGKETPFSYDEDRALNVKPDGKPVVESSGATATGTITEVRAEASDRDDVEALGTITKAAGEASDRTAIIATQTRIRGERSDHVEDQPSNRGQRGVPAILLGTHTAGPGEPTDPAEPPLQLWPTKAAGIAPVRRVVH